jgi:hypothetical protein
MAPALGHSRRNRGVDDSSLVLFDLKSGKMVMNQPIGGEWSGEERMTGVVEFRPGRVIIGTSQEVFARSAPVMMENTQH